VSIAAEELQRLEGIPVLDEEEEEEESRHEEGSGQ